MKKIIAFLLFIPLFIISIYIGFTQVSNKEVKDTPLPTLIPTIQVVSEINLTISSPDSGITVSTNTVSIQGSTESLASVVINDVEVIANTDGSFKTILTLDEGENYISIVAYNDLGNVAEREIMVTRAVEGL